MNTAWTPNRYSLLCALLCVCLTAACGDDADKLGDLQGNTSETTSTTSTSSGEDAGLDAESDTTEDATTDTSEDAADDTSGDTGPDVPEVRRMMMRPLMGSTPVNNRVLDPRFSSEGSTFWIYFDLDEFQLIPMVRTAYADNPTGLTSVQDPFRNPGASRNLLISAKTRNEPTEVSIWIGARDDDAGPGRPPTRMNVIGMAADGSEMSVALRWSGDPVVTDEGVWWKASTVMEEPPVGFIYITVEGLNRGSYAVTAPVVIGAEVDQKKANGFEPVEIQPISSKTRAAVRAMNDLRDGRPVPNRFKPLELPAHAPALLRNALQPKVTPQPGAPRR